MQVLMFLLLIVGNMRNMQYNMQQYAKYAKTISICRICTPHFADDPSPTRTPWIKKFVLVYTLAIGPYTMPMNVDLSGYKP